MPYVIMTATLMLGGYLLAAFANDLSQLSLRAYGTHAQSVLGGPVIWTAAKFPQIKTLAVLLPVLVFGAWWMRRLTDTTCLIYLCTWAFAILTWAITVAYFSVQPGILG
jgi:hypothetical protein